MRTINQYSTAIFCAVFALCASIDGGPGSSQVSQEYWLQQAETKLLNRRARQGSREHQKRAKNVIIFIGDGMGPAVVTATRIYRGQKEKRDNDQDSLFWEEFPHGGLVKTHSLNQHVTDSGASATAIFYGRKVNSRTLGVDGTVRQNDCSAVDNGKIESIASMALKNGMSVGFVTTTLVTDATPAALFAHTAQRGIESDFDAQKFKLTGCVDIAKQLVDYYPGNQFKVILGGGSRKMMPNYTENNPEESELIGERLDGRNLVEDWKSGSGRRSVVWNRDELLDTDYNKTDFLMGMFAPKRFPYELDAALKNKTNYPTLSEMTEAAIKVLQKNPNGFLLLVEGALIDSALHANYAKFAVTETLAMEKAVATARTLTSKDDTLLIVTADHSHVLTIPGYWDRNASIFGAQIPAKDKVDDLPNARLIFTNGPSALRHSNKTTTIQRLNLSTVNTESAYFQQPAFIPMTKETHGGEDVGLWADGPFDYLFTGTMDNTYIAYAISCALCFNGKLCKICQQYGDDRENEDVFSAIGIWPQKSVLMLTTVFSIGSFFILVILLFIHLSQLRRKSWDVAKN